IVLYPDDFGGHAAFGAFEIHFAILLLMTATDMPRGQPAAIVATAAFLLRFEKTLVRLRPGDFIKPGKRLKPLRRSEWAKTFECHIKPGRSCRLPSASRSLSSNAGGARVDRARVFLFRRN